MVYCGKPSKDCDLCRKRRIRCDKIPSGCSQCKHAGRDCPGYRSQIDLLFRDESDKVYQKFRKDRLPLGRVSEPKPSTISDGLESVFNHALIPQQKLTITPLTESIFDPAVNFFLSTYIRESQYEYLSTLYASNPSNDILRPGIEAAALASLSQQTNRLDLLTVARKRYMMALKNLNAQLGDGANCDEQTLAAIMTMALFETIVRTDDEASKSFSKHIHGALALLSYRPLWESQSEVAEKLFRQIRLGMQLECLQQHTRVPLQLRSLMTHEKSFGKQSQVQISMSAFANDLIGFRAALADGDLGDPGGIIRQAQALDEHWKRRITDDLRRGNSYDVVEIDTDDPVIFEQTYHVYADHRWSQMWNSLRMMSLILNEVTYRAALGMMEENAANAEATTDLDLTQVMLEAATVVREAAAQICHSVPQYLQRQDSSAAGTTTPGQIASGYFFLWPLFIAGRSALVSPAVRQYAIHRLKDIASTCRILQAEKAAEALEDRVDDEEDW